MANTFASFQPAKPAGHAASQPAEQPASQTATPVSSASPGPGSPAPAGHPACTAPDNTDGTDGTRLSPASAAAPSPAPLPAHIAIIMDGNGRWATQRGLPRSAGHEAGATAAREVITECRKLGVRHLTLYTFSRENWKRPREEVSFLFRLLVDFLRKELPLLMREDIRVRLFGEIEGLPRAARLALEHVMAKTAGNQAMQLNLAMNYAGREELARAVREMMRAGLAPHEVTEERLAEFLYTAGQPDPDLLIRTSGEMRLSNYLLFQLAYSEFYFTDVLWPDFTAAELHRALAAYGRRERRFGCASAHEAAAGNPAASPDTPPTQGCPA